MAPRFIYDDVVRLIKTDQIGTVKEVHESSKGLTYALQLRTATAEQIEVPEDDLELVKIANADETGFSLRYIT